MAAGAGGGGGAEGGGVGGAGLYREGGGLVVLGSARVALHLDLAHPPDAGSDAEVAVDVGRSGRWNAVRFWLELGLGPGLPALSSAPADERCRRDGRGDSARVVYLGEAPPTLSPARAGGEPVPVPHARGGAVAMGSTASLPCALQWLGGDVPVAAGTEVRVHCRHNKARLRFDLPAGTPLLALQRPMASFPAGLQFAGLADRRRLAAYYRAIERQVAKAQAELGRPAPGGSMASPAEAGEVAVLDIGCGSGILGMMAARSGAPRVVACDLHDALSSVARRCTAANGLGKQVSVVRRDAALLERGRDVPRSGCNLAVLDLFDCQLTGDGVLDLLAACRKNGALTRDHRAVPAGATLWCMGLEVYTSEVEGFDFSPANKHRWDREARTVLLSDVPHRALTRPTKVFDFAFDGRGGAARREKVLRAECVQAGYLNAVAVWFDLHLDEEETLTSAPVGCLAGGRFAPALERLHAGAAPEAGGAGKSLAGEGPAPRTDGGVGAGQGGEPRADRAPRPFEAASEFTGPREGAYFGVGPDGQLGYHSDEGPAEAAARGGLVAGGAGGGQPEAGAATLNQFSRALIEALEGGEGGGEEEEECPPAHHWGQGLFYLERACQVESGQRATLLARREGGKVRFSLREGVGSWVGKSPWKIEWGGGASVESPHYQRVHYCELLVRDFLMRVRSHRFPPIEQDMKVMLANCGNLFLDPATVQEVLHELTVLEMLHSQAEFSPGASLTAVTREPPAALLG